MASAQRRSGTRGRPPPKRWVFTRTGSNGARTAQSALEIRNPVVVRLLGVRARVRFVRCREVFIPDSIRGYSDRLLAVAQPVMQGTIPALAQNHAHAGLHTREGERDSGVTVAPSAETDPH